LKLFERLPIPPCCQVQPSRAHLSMQRFLRPFSASQTVPPRICPKWQETVIVLGIVTGYWVGDIVLQRNSYLNWTVLYGVSAALSIPFLLSTFVIPRSKRWLLMHPDNNRAHQREALESMKFVYKGDEASITLAFEQLARSIASGRLLQKQESSVIKEEGFLDVLCHKFLWSPTVWPAFRAAMGLIVLQQFSVQPSILSYAAVLFDAVGWNGHAAVVTTNSIARRECLHGHNRGSLRSEALAVRLLSGAPHSRPGAVLGISRTGRHPIRVGEVRCGIENGSVNRHVCLHWRVPNWIWSDHVVCGERNFPRPSAGDSHRHGRRAQLFAQLFGAISGPRPARCHGLGSQLRRSRR
jgi:Sugar (and other) transporter